MVGSDGQSLDHRLGRSPSSPSNSRTQDKESIHNRKCHQGADYKNKEGVEERASATSRRDGNPEALMTHRVLVFFW